MKYLLLTFAVLSKLFVAMANKETFIGKWKIVEALDEQFQPFALPEGQFFIQLENDKNGDNALMAFIRIGNNMRTKITFGDSTSDGDSISVGGLMSTMMMPPEPLFRLETYLSNTMPKMTTVQTEDSGDRLILSGLGKITCEKVEE